MAQNKKNLKNLLRTFINETLVMEIGSPYIGDYNLEPPAELYSDEPCETCEFSAEEGERYCPDCGKDLQHPTPKSPPQTTPESASDDEDDWMSF